MSQRAPRDFEHDGSNPWRVVALAVTAATLGVLVYWNAFDNPFVYDDLRTVVQNPSIRDLGNIEAILLFERFRPLVNLTYALDYAVWQLRPWGYHLTSALLHAANVLLFFVLARVVWRDRDRHLGVSTPHLLLDLSAFAAAALWAVHPMMSEAVGYVSGRSEVLCGVFFLAGFLCFRAYLIGGGGSRLVAGLLCFILATAAKEVGAMLLFVVAVYDVLFLGTIGDPRRWWRFHLPAGALVLLGAFVRLWQFFTVEASHLPRPVWSNVLTEWEILWRYLGLLLWPASQSVVHPTQSVTTPGDPMALVAGAALVVLIVTCFFLRRRFPLLGFGVAWFLLVLAPSSTLIPLNELMAEHRVYVASCGFFLALVGLPGRAWGERSPKAAVTALVALLGIVSAATVQRNKVWSDPVKLWGDAAHKAPLTWRPFIGLGDALRQRGDCASAIAPYAQAVKLQPTDLGTRMNLGICLAQTGRPEEAEVVFAEALEVDPDFIKAYNNLGRLSVIAGRRRLGEQYFNQALTRAPGNVTALLNLIRLYESDGRPAEQILQMCREVAAVEPRAPGIQDCLRKYNP